MKDDRWKQVDELFEAALERRPGERAAFLDAACAGDPGLRREVEELLRSDEQPTNFIEAVVLDAAAGLAATEATPREHRAATPAPKGPTREARIARASDSIDDARFVPGDKLAERYRIVGLLGRGGMGEVYRADDLKLKQPVALKFLPEKLSADGESLARFFREVSVARQISHRHVCRVYDTGEADGFHFISMEYVRGEELALLLKRIGRLPHDKAVEIARQLCAGLAAIHEQGVLHRDLKPANVMIDERGDVRITDFGIAALAEETRNRELVGTPAYMSPEQLEARELTPRSDIYSLGLVLYELFTGKKAFEAASLPELLALRRSDTTPTSPSRFVTDLDPLVERIILRCLERDPKDRPASALQVAAALPGGDPLAAALAAGETPSPEMVAAAPKEGSLRPLVAAALLAFVFAGLALVVLLSGRTALHRLVPLERSAGDLQRHAAEIARRLGHDAPAADSVYSFTADIEVITHVHEHDPSPDRWQKLKTGRPPAVNFWFRQSPRPLEPYDSWRVKTHDPPNEVAGMVLTILDTAGRLIHFEAVPAQLEERPSAPAAPDWGVLFAEAGLDPAGFRPAAPRWNSPQVYDARAAWEGSYPERPELPVRVEAAAYRGRPVYFELAGAWRNPDREIVHEESIGQSVGAALLLTLYFGALALGALLAWRNLRLGRGDRRGALRLALFTFALKMVFWVFYAHHIPTIGEVIGLFIVGLQSALFWACFVGLMYLALEPFLRRRWPEWVISWSRLLAGNYRDPLVGRDVLVGAAFAVGIMLASPLETVGPELLGRPQGAPNIGSNLIYELGLLGLNGFVPLIINQTVASILFSFIAASVLLFFAMLLRRKWLGVVAGWLFLCSPFVLTTTDKSAIGLLAAVLGPTLVVVALARFGLLTLITAFFFMHIWPFFPVTTQFSAWYASGFVIELVLLVALALYGFRTSLAGQPLLRGKFLED